MRSKQSRETKFDPKSQDRPVDLHRTTSLSTLKIRPNKNGAISEIKNLFPPLAVEMVSVQRLRRNPRNSRTHSEKQIAQIAAAIRAVGFLVPIIRDEKWNILAGHGRYAAALLLGLTEVPVICAKHLTAEKKRAFVIADNRLAELAGWDNEILRVELAELSALDLDFDVEITGFDSVDIDQLMARPDEKASVDPADETPLPETLLPAITKRGMLWKLGRHLLLCGDARDAGSYKRLLEGETAQMAFTDPPYNVKIKGHVVGKGRHKHREFEMGSGEMSHEEFTSLLSQVTNNIARVSSDGAIAYICMDWRHIDELLSATQSVFGDPKNLCVWVKSNGGMGTFYRSQHELVFVFKNGKAPHINNFGLGERGRYRTNVWNYPGVNSFGRERDEALAAHPTVKPVAMVADAIRDCSRRGGIVLDPFGGSGTTLIAAEKTGRVARLIEIDPHYCDVIVRRCQKLTGEQVIDTESGLRFDELKNRLETDIDDRDSMTKKKEKKHAP